jgi:hypothetical protein
VLCIISLAVACLFLGAFTLPNNSFADIGIRLIQQQIKDTVAVTSATEQLGVIHYLSSFGQNTLDTILDSSSRASSDNSSNSDH